MFQPPGKTDSNSPKSEFRWIGWKGQQKSNEAFTTFFRFEMCHKIWRFAKCTAVRQITSQRVQLMPRKNGSKSSLLQFTAIWPGFMDLRPGLNKSDTPAPFDQSCSKKRYSWSPEPPVYSPFTSGVCIPAGFGHIDDCEEKKYIEQRDDNDDCYKKRYRTKACLSRSSQRLHYKDWHEQGRLRQS